MRLSNIKSIVLDAHENNSYQHVNIYINNDLVHNSAIFYGYDDFYEQYSLNWLKNNIFSDYANKNIVNNCSFFWQLRDVLEITILGFKNYINKKELDKKAIK